MSIHTTPMNVPDETARVAQAAFPKGNPYLLLRDRLGSIYNNEQFTTLFSSCGRPAESPWRLAIITVMQFGENLSDPQAADSVRSRIDWKYLLGLELTDPGFDFSVLSEFRTRLVEGRVEMQLLNQLLEVFKQQDLLKGRKKQRTDSTHVLGAIRDLNRLEVVHETLRKTLNSLARAAPNWLQERVPVEWYQRYGARFDQYRLPKFKTAYQDLVESIGKDGYQLWAWVQAAETPPAIRQQEALEILRQVWVQNYYLEEDQIHWRETGNLPSIELLIQSPHDLEVRYSRKRRMEWKGYKVHLSETCEPDQPHWITHVETTPATTPDVSMTSVIQTALASKGLPPSEHLLDAGYVDAEHLVNSQAQGIEIVGPVGADTSRQAREGQGFDLVHFSVDWSQKVVTCPQGRTSRVWSQSQDQGGHAVIDVRFASADCQICPVRLQCTRSEKNPRSLKLRAQAQYEALQRARRRQESLEFWERYRLRSGVEGTLSQGVRKSDMRRSRYIGLMKTHLQMIVTAVAINLARFVAWTNEIPLAATRIDAFAALAPPDL